MLAAGGTGYLYRHTTNPDIATGDGIALGYEAGAAVANLEFVQFHPTALDFGRDPAPLASEALRGEGALLVNGEGHRFMPALHDDAELAPRDIVARGVFAEIRAGHGAYLDCRKAIGDGFADKFPTVYRYCSEAGLDPRHDLLPIVPAAHYHMGGILTDKDGKTSISLQELHGTGKEYQPDD